LVGGLHDLLENFVALQKYTNQAEKDRHVYLKALAAFEAGKKTTSVSSVFSGGFIACTLPNCFIIVEADNMVCQQSSHWLTSTETCFTFC